MNKVIVFRATLLPRSETFIKEQLLTLTLWHAVLVGYRKATDGLDLGGIDVRLVPALAGATLSRWMLRGCHGLGLPHRPTVRLLRRLQADLVHVHFGTDAVDLWPSMRKTGLPMLVTLHGYDISIHRTWWEAGHGGWLRRSYPRRLLRMAHDPKIRFIAVSHAIRQRAIEYGIPADKITLAYIGINTQRFKPGGLPLEQRRKQILFVGRMVEKKAPLLMVRAFAKVAGEVPDAQLVMMGEGPLLPAAKALAAELGVDVHFLGVCSSEEVLNQLHQSRVFCLPSITASNGDSEGLPISILEAQACGVAVVTSASGAVDEVIKDGFSGFTFKPNDLDRLCLCLSQLLRNNTKLLAFSQAGLRVISEQFSMQAATEHLERGVYATVDSAP